MNAFKLDLMTLLAVFVILAVIVTMTLGTGDRTNANTFSQPKSSIANPAGGVAPVSNASFSYGKSHTAIPAPKHASRSWN